MQQESAEKEIRRHRDYLADLMQKINHFRSTEKDSMHAKMWSVMQDNLNLLSDIDKLRAEHASVQMRIGVAEAANRGPRRLVREYNIDGVNEQIQELIERLAERQASIELLQRQLRYMQVRRTTVEEGEVDEAAKPEVAGNGVAAIEERPRSIFASCLISE